VIASAQAALLMSGDPNAGDGYAFGSFIAELDDAWVVGHPGDWMGYSSLLFAWPATRTVVAVLVPKEGMALDGTLGGWVIELYATLEGA
jgi:hypothetical protein